MCRRPQQPKTRRERQQQQQQLLNSEWIICSGRGFWRCAQSPHVFRVKSLPPLQNIAKKASSNSSSFEFKFHSIFPISFVRLRVGSEKFLFIFSSRQRRHTTGRSDVMMSFALLSAEKEMMMMMCVGWDCWWIPIEHLSDEINIDWRGIELNAIFRDKFETIFIHFRWRWTRMRSLTDSWHTPVDGFNLTTRYISELRRYMPCVCGEKIRCFFPINFVRVLMNWKFSFASLPTLNTLSSRDGSDEDEKNLHKKTKVNSSTMLVKGT